MYGRETSVLYRIGLLTSSVNNCAATRSVIIWILVVMGMTLGLKMEGKLRTNKIKVVVQQQRHHLAEKELAHIPRRQLP